MASFAGRISVASRLIILYLLLLIWWCVWKKKNDQFREGSQVVIARADKPPCPVAVVEKFLRKGEHDHGRTIWRRILNTKNGPKLQNAPMMYSRASELFKKAVRVRMRVLMLRSTGCTAYDQVVLQQQQLWVFQNVFSRGKADDVPLRLKTIIFWNLSLLCFMLRKRCKALNLHVSMRCVLRPMLSQPCVIKHFTLLFTMRVPAVCEKTFYAS